MAKHSPALSIRIAFTYYSFHSHLHFFITLPTLSVTIFGQIGELICSNQNFVSSLCDSCVALFYRLVHSLHYLLLICSLTTQEQTHTNTQTGIFESEINAASLEYVIRQIFLHSFACVTVRELIKSITIIITSNIFPLSK